jgi:signal transduction histidine kinase
MANGSNLLLPTFGIFHFNWFGQAVTLIMVAFIFYAIMKHQLLNIKVITTEIFATLIPLALLVDVFLSKTKVELFWKSALFVAVSFFSVFLVRSVLKEVRSKERLEKMATELRLANLDLQKLDKAKSDFISIASHQLRTPLSITKGLASMVIEGSFGEVGDKVKEQVTKIYDSNERLNKLVDSLLDLSHIEGGKLQFTFAKIDFAAMAQSVADELSLNAQKKGLAFSFKKPAEPLFVRADEQKLRQVALNLVDNAIKYTPKGGVEVEVERKNGSILLSIKDTGMGFKEDEKNQLFQKFVRGNNAPRLHTEGAGIGLYVAKKMLEEHKGEVWAESEGEGKGSTFFVKLPEWTEARQ